jgi:uncharacterized RDD family membrane protein YckC
VSVSFFFLIFLRRFLMEDSQAQSAQAPALQYAGVGIRFLALLIDGIIIGVVSAIINGVAAATQNSAITTLAGVVIAVLALLYFIWMEATQGATLGKMALGLRVVKSDGSSPIGWPASIIRNLLRIIDGLFVYLVGAIIIWTSPLKQRLGDKVAQTLVVRTR